jgi:hypothetical protein
MPRKVSTQRGMRGLEVQLAHGRSCAFACVRRGVEWCAWCTLVNARPSAAVHASSCIEAIAICITCAARASTVSDMLLLLLHLRHHRGRCPTRTVTDRLSVTVSPTLTTTPARFNTPTTSVYFLHPSMVSHVVSLFRFRSRCLIRISVAPFARRRLIRPFAALPLPHATPRSLPRVCVRRQATLPSVRSRRHTLVHPSFTLRTVRI